MQIVFLSLGILIVAGFFVQEVCKWKRQSSLCEFSQKCVRTGLFVSTELCLGLFILFPFVKINTNVKGLLWYLASILALILILMVLLICDLFMTKASLKHKK